MGNQGDVRLTTVAAAPTVPQRKRSHHRRPADVVRETLLNLAAVGGGVAVLTLKDDANSVEDLTPVASGSSLATTGPVNGVYTTQFKSGILSGLLGGTYGVYLQTKVGSGWVSTLATANASMGPAGSNPVCTVN
ncbi:hypothetical protein [Arthrobacter sp. FW306-04-A]|uniref:hypothetical protein n=1 Tax=Arthrobacter sp. FW306-04-A TaxID=2879619 RepID=UPI0037BEF9C0|nr:hypothetical protein LFT43_00465 [Arthrobacter sp. FW306-04-A]